jgi:hypothetical protein
MGRTLASLDAELPGNSRIRSNVAIAVAENARDRIYQIAAACRAPGLRQTATLTGIGVLMGLVELYQLPKLWAVAGVLAVELES